MSRREKLLARIRNNPRSVTYDELAGVLEWHGFECRKGKGSHRIFKRGGTKIVIVWRKPHVHSNAVKEALAVIDSLSEPGEIA
ncbi:MAG: addiction module toxin, HicA family [Ardenticatenales bacterium]|nr:addiction module toxin, HicA family [Ardenticatenales bacterium]